ncbi:MAG: SRPBCC family protein [Acidimicrobiia bacterium]
MKITESFTVQRTLDQVWPMFMDVPALAQCLPGAELTSTNDDGSYGGKVSVKLGPIAASFEGTATVEFDEAAHTAKIRGRGVDRSGGSQGQVVVDVTLAESGVDNTDVTIDAKVTLAGPIAQFGRTGLVGEVSRRLIDEFSQCVHAKLDASSEEEASAVAAGEVRGISLFFASWWAAFKSWLKRIVSRS